MSEGRKDGKKSLYTRKMNDAHQRGEYCAALVFNRHHPHRNQISENIIGSGHCKRYPAFRDEKTGIFWCERHYLNHLKPGNYIKSYKTKDKLLNIHESLHNLSIKVSEISHITQSDTFQLWWKDFRSQIAKNTLLLSDIHLSTKQTLTYLTYAEQYEIAQARRDKEQLELELQTKIKLDIKLQKEKEKKTRENIRLVQIEAENLKKTQEQAQRILQEAIKKEQEQKIKDEIARQKEHDLKLFEKNEIIRIAEEQRLHEETKKQEIIQQKTNQELFVKEQETIKLEEELKEQSEILKKNKAELDKLKERHDIELIISNIEKSIGSIRYLLAFNKKLIQVKDTFPVDEGKTITDFLHLFQPDEKIIKIENNITKIQETIINANNIQNLLDANELLTQVNLDYDSINNSSLLKETNQIYEKNLKQPVRIYLRMNVPNPERLLDDSKIIDYTLQYKRNQGALITYTTSPQETKQYGPFYSIFPHTFSLGNDMIYSAETQTSVVHGQEQPAVNQAMKGVFDLLSSGYNATLCGYGFSGTGKTFTLFGSKEKNITGIIQLGLQELGKVKLYSVFEIYGKITDITKSGKKADVKVYQYFGSKVVQGKIENDLVSNASDYEELNGKNLQTLYDVIHNKRLSSERVKKTPNNPESSRGHLFFIIEIDIEGHRTSVNAQEQTTTITTKTCYFTLIDMAGAENPEAIARTYFNFNDDFTYNNLLSSIKSEASRGAAQLNFPKQLKEEYKDNIINPQTRKTGTQTNVKKAIDTIQEGFYINDSLNELTYFLKDQQYKRKKFNEPESDTKPEPKKIWSTLPSLVIKPNDPDFPYYDEKETYNGESIFTVNSKEQPLIPPFSMTKVLTDLSLLGGETSITRNNNNEIIQEVRYQNDGRIRMVLTVSPPTYSDYNIDNIKLQYILLVLVKADEDDPEKEAERIRARVKTFEFANRFKITTSL